MKFIDTNVFVYVADSKNPAKRTIARELPGTVPAQRNY
jgi:predicted nucleic acid-binding protein